MAGDRSAINSIASLADPPRRPEPHGWLGAAIRTFLPGLLTIALVAGAVFFVAIPSLRRSLMDSKRTMLAELTKITCTMLEEYQQRVDSGELAHEEARRRAASRIRNLRYGPQRKDYFWINDMTPRMVMHPYLPGLEGQGLSNYTDPAGKRLFVEMVQAVRDDGEGYVSYRWQWQDDPGRVGEKLSHVRRFEPWGWIVGTGVYLDDVDARIASATCEATWFLLAALALVVGLCGYMMYATHRLERQRMEAWRILEQREATLRAIFHGAFQFTGLLDAEGRLVEANEPALAFAGVEMASLKGLPLWRTPWCSGDEQLAERVRQAVQQCRNGQFVRMEADCFGVEGRRALLDFSLKPIRDAGGRIVGMISEGRDISEMREAQAAREKLEEQLRHSQKMEAVGQLAGGVAHDFNNLLQVILGYGEMAQSEAGEDGSLREHLEQMMAAGRKARTLVSQLLAFSRRQVLKMEDLDVNDVISDLMTMIRRVIGEHISVKVHRGAEAALVRGDRGQLGQILTNLCVNSRDAMPEGGMIMIETKNVDVGPEYCRRHAWATAGRYVRISVTDTGRGMDKQTLERVFEPFFTTKDIGKGTGLGLATVYGLVKQHGGMIDAYSEVGLGSTFRVYLPLIKSARPVSGQMPEPVASGGNETILLAEDEPTVRLVSVKMLENAGYTVLVAEDGRQALRLLEEHAGEIDLAILDVVMPELGGRAVYDRIRKTWPDVRVLFASGYSANAVHTNFVLEEGLSLIQKPYAGNELLRKVRELLDD